MLMTTREFFIDGVCMARISGDTGWQAKSYTLSGSSTHTLKWCYIKNSYGSSGSDCGWVDYVQTPMPSDWQTISYTHDPYGRRIAKAYDGITVAKYLYDGPSLIAEYDGFGTLLRKYVYGPGIDQPICMIDVADANAAYYYHFDGLGSVVALTDDAGDTVEVYEYSIFGEVSASDPNHPNPFLFTGREFDKETGLYYYRARYYNPYIGRFLQTDPAGQGMNPYTYCGNDPTTRVDPFGLASVAFYDGDDDVERTNFETCATQGDYDYIFDLRVPASIFAGWTKLGLSEGEIELKWIRVCLKSLSLQGVDVDEVYFFDHGWDGFSETTQEYVDEGGLELGDAMFTVRGPREDGPTDTYLHDCRLSDFADTLAKVTKADDPTTVDVYEGATIHLRGCFEGLIADEVAEWSNRKTTGFTNRVSPQADPGNGHVYADRGGDYVEYGPTGEALLRIPAGSYWDTHVR
jgi:RHS repeat-associated protein